jgi:hypothetical protein
MLKNLVGGLWVIAIGGWALWTAQRGTFSRFGRNIDPAQGRLIFRIVGIGLVAAGIYFIWFGVKQP